MRVKQPYGRKLFEEQQALRQTWVAWVVVISTIFPLALTGVIIIADKGITIGEKITAFSIVLGVNLINVLAVYTVRLDTLITDEGIFYRWRPFTSKYNVVAWRDVQEITLKKYPFSNVGYHKRKGFGKVNVVKGKDGLQLLLRSNQLIYLGTQRLPAVEYALNMIKFNKQ